MTNTTNTKYYRFYSRQNGYPNGVSLKCFESDIIEDKYDETSKFIDMSGKEILKYSNIINNKDIIKIAKIFPSWYYYPNEIEITDIRIYT
jgi:hypothetical protein